MTEQPPPPDTPAADSPAADGPAARTPPATRGASQTPYTVLARKYRPADFSALIGQEALVRTLSNAIARGRLAQAYMLTGVRGVGKTTTARIIARALNCIGPDGQGGPTVTPCGVCEHCRAIAEDRHVDILELDAASRTGVGDMREILDGVRYRPTSARYKIYIIDEVHMLSTQAFNALLKTLEEPPAHVKFIFATTEIRKVPVTVLSRCQRFDLRRVEAETLARHFAGIAQAEGAGIEAEALALIARAADGSVRDGLSLLDQAIVHGAGTVEATQVRAMLGLADRAAVFDLFQSLMGGDIAAALDQLADHHRAGADPLVVVQDLLDVTHWVTRVKLIPASADDPAIAEAERTRGRELAQTLSMPVLSRAWQMLLKGLSEARGAPSTLQAVEMLLIRVAFAADLPSPEDALKALKDGRGEAGQPPRGPATPPSGPAAEASAPPTAESPAPAPASTDAACPGDFDAVVALFEARGEPRLAAHLKRDVRLVACAPGRLELNLDPDAPLPPDFLPRLRQRLSTWTGRLWVVERSTQAGLDPLSARLLAEARQEPLIAALLDAFPGAKLRLEPLSEINPPPPEPEMEMEMDMNWDADSALF
ncbi:DNA polymerase III subunit gamma/tau [Roseospirillum parvum]|uniref:DNA polymerase III subunit gamma/tau n=1 Tax=Roseospirillum parvum TaxID=83401 RepID=A0A1G7W3J3_9PROT|nr:DNA polymerase III subunit gamma/tau [Roseospirillum parvum]SDG66582.1 DNA polymerase-3 subunit gamma/tau [Roseospirillum parvum]